MVKTTKTILAPANEPNRHSIEELEEQFHALQKRMAKARKSYLTTHKQAVELARRELKSVQARLAEARTSAAKAAVAARVKGTASANNQLKKARAASLLLAQSLGDARDTLITAQSKLYAAKPFDRKLAARARVLEKFERDWEKKIREEAIAQALRARKAAARRRVIAKARAVKKSVKAAAPRKAALKTAGKRHPAKKSSKKKRTP
jgi:hypothetical protein